MSTSTLAHYIVVLAELYLHVENWLRNCKLPLQFDLAATEFLNSDKTITCSITLEFLTVEWLHLKLQSVNRHGVLL